MKQWITDLLALQEIDMRIRGLKTRLSIIPEEISKLGKELAIEKSKLEHAKESFVGIELEIKKKESAIKDQNETMKKYNTQSALIKKNDEYRAMMKEIENVKNKISDIETEQLGFMDKIEAVKNAFKSEEKLFRDREKAIAEEENELKDLEGKLKAEIEKQNSSREEFSTKISPDLLSTYKRLLSKKTGTPLIDVHQGICGNCHLKLTPQTVNSVRKEMQVFCDNCGHLLYPGEPNE
jgi:predicted  nucleic acid-binding Zn-ribbon protein